MNDSMLMAGIKADDSKSLENLIDKYASYVFTIIKNIGKNYLTYDDLEEISADVFISIWKSSKDFELDGTCIKPYLAAIARNKTKTVLRTKRADLIALEDDLIDISLPVDELVAEKQLYEQVKCIINEFQQPDKEIFMRRFFYYQKTSQIAKEVGMNIKTVETRLLRGREKLQKLFIKRGVI